jgi:hypothetical protein
MRNLRWAFAHHAAEALLHPGSETNRDDEQTTSDSQVDEDLVEALEQHSARSLSAEANASLRQAIDVDHHRKAALVWLAELDAKYGKATPEEQAENEAFPDEIGLGDSAARAAGGGA